MRHLYAIARKHKGLIAAFCSLGLAGTFLQSFSARYFQTVIDHFTAKTLTPLTIAVYGAALVLLNVATYLDEYPWRKLEHSITLGLKIAALRKVSAIDYLSYTKLGTGALIQRIENGAAAGMGILFGFYLRLAGDLIPAMLFSILFVFTISKAVAGAVLVGYIAVFVITNLLLKALYRIKERILVNEERLGHFLVRGFMEMVVFRINRRFPRELQKTETAAGEIIASKVRMSMTHEAFFAIFAVLVAFVKIGIIAYGWTSGALSIGQIVALIALVDHAYQPVAVFNVLYVQYKLDKIAFARYTEFLDAKEEARLTAGQILPQIYGDISFSNISFDYDGREIFGGLNLHIRRGTKAAFVGESGCGKSTAVKLLTGLLRPGSGQLLVDGFDIAHINLDSYYQHIAYLP